MVIDQVPQVQSIRQATLCRDSYARLFGDVAVRRLVGQSCDGRCDPVNVMSGNFSPYPTAFPYGNGMVLHFYQQQESSTTKTVHKVINKGLKAYVYSPHTGENFH